MTTPSGVQSVSVTGASGSIADVFVFGKYISLLDTKVIAGGRSAAFEILSREVVHVQIPANVIPTTIQNVDGDATYVEVYLSTPNGISNSVLIPYDGSPTPPPKPRGYDVAPASQSIDVFYQWLTGPDQKPGLVASAPPSATQIAINWDSETGLGPRQIQVQFVATVNSQNVIATLPATASNKGDYTVDGPSFIATLFKRLQDFTAAGTILPASIPFSVRVQPWLPADSQGMRVRTEPKPLKSKVTVNLYYDATGVNALPAAQPSTFLDPSSKGEISPRQLKTTNISGEEKFPVPRRDQDPAIVRTAQEVKSLPSFLTAPQQTPALSNPALLAPNITSEAEQVARLLTGQPLPPNVPQSEPLSAAPAPGQGNLPVQNVAALAATMAPRSSTAQMPNILVNPSPVIVVAHPPADAKKKQQPKSRLHKMMNSLGNRISQAIPDR